MSINSESMPTHNAQPEDPLEALYNAPAITDEERMEATFNAPAITDEERFGTQSSPETTGDNNGSEDTVEAPAGSTPDIYARGAQALTLSTERVAALLGKLSEGVEARRESREKAAATVKRIGGSALRTARTAGVLTVGMSVFTAELAVDGGRALRGKVMTIAMTARRRLAERAAHRENDARTIEAQNAAFDTYEPNVQYSEDHAEADEMNRQKKADQAYAEMSYGPNVRFSQDHEEANAMNEQKKAAQEYAYNSYSNNIDTTRRRERQEDAYDSYEDNIEYSEILERRRLAQERKAARRARNQERFNTVRDKGSEVLSKARGFAGRIGRMALKTYHRGRAAVSAAVSAGVETWKQTAA